MRSAIGVAGVVMALAGCGGGESTTGPTPPPAGPVVASVEVSPAAPTVRVGATVQLTAVAKDAQGNPVPGKVLTWSTSSGSVATVSTTGLVTGVARGTATISASVDGRSGSSTAEVTDETSLLPVPGCRDCLEIAPGGLLLAGTGEEAQLAAYLVDGAGVRTKVAATFTSAKPGVVTVSAAGVARAAALGSAQVTAQANGKTSTPILVVVAIPAAGAVLVADTLIDGRPTPSDPTAPYGVGYKYKVRLRGMVPTVGQMLVASGSQPVLGRVVRVTPAPGGLAEVELELRPLAESFREFAIQESMPLVDAPQASVPSGLWPGAAPFLPADEPLKEGQFRLGPFACEAGAGAAVSFPLNVVVEALELNPQLVLDLSVSESGGNILAVAGTLAPRLTVTPRLTAAIEAELKCRKTIRRLRLPARVGGALSLLVSPVVPVGVGFTMGIKAGLPNLSVKATVQGAVSIGMAMNCVNFQCAMATQQSNNLTGSFTPNIPPLGARHETEVAGFAFAKLELSNVLAEAAEELGENVSLTLLDFLVGLKQTMALATPANQADDPSYASEVTLAAFWEAKGGAEVEVGGLLSLQLFAYEGEGSAPLATTPKGIIEFALDRVRAGPGDQEGDPVLLKVTLDPVTYLGAAAVEEVRMFWRSPSGALVPGCDALRPERPGQREFECEVRFTEAHVGPQTYHGFVTAKIFGLAFNTPFEIGPDAKATIEVLPSCLAPSGPSPAPSLADDSCGRTIEGNVDVRTTGDLAALADVGAVTGNLTIHPAVVTEDLRELSFLSDVGLHLIVNSSSVKSLAGMTSLRRVRRLQIGAPSLRSLAGLHRLEGEIEWAQISGGQLTSLDGISNLRFGHLILAQTGLRTPGLSNTAVGWLVVAGEPVLETLAGFVPLESGRLTGLGLTDVPLLREVPLTRGVTEIGERGLTLRNVGLLSLADLAAVEHVEGGVVIDSPTAAASAAGLAGLRTIGGSLSLFPGSAPTLVLPALQEVAFALEIRQTVSCAGPQQVSLPALTTLNGSNTQYLAFRLTIEATRCPLTARLPVFTMAKLTNPALPNTITITGSQLVGLEMAVTVPDAVMTVSQTGLQSASLPGMTGGAGRIYISQNPLLQTLTVAPVDVYDLAVGSNPVLSSLSASGHIRHGVGIINNPMLSTQAAQSLAFTLGPGAAKNISGNGQP